MFRSYIYVPFICTRRFNQFKFECLNLNMIVLISSVSACNSHIATKISTCPYSKVNNSEIHKNKCVTKVNSVVAILTEQFLPFIDYNENFFPLLRHILFISAVIQRSGIPQRMNRTINCRASPRQNLRMVMRRNEVVDFPFSPASGIPNAVVIKKVQNESRIIRWQWQR